MICTAMNTMKSRIMPGALCFLLLFIASIAYAQDPLHTKDSLLVAIDSLQKASTPLLDSLLDAPNSYLDSLPFSISKDTLSSWQSLLAGRIKTDTLIRSTALDTVKNIQSAISGLDEKRAEKEQKMIERFEEKQQAWKDSTTKRVERTLLDTLDHLPASLGGLPNSPGDILNVEKGMPGELGLPAMDERLEELVPGAFVPGIPSEPFTTKIPGSQGLSLEEWDMPGDFTVEQDKLEDITSQLDRYQRNTGEYSQKIEQYNPGTNDLDDVMDRELGGRAGLKDLQESPGAGDMLASVNKDQAEQYIQYVDPEFIKKNLYQKAQVVATDLFRTKSGVLKPAMEKLAAHKKRYAGAKKTVFDVKKKDPLKSKDLAARFVPSITLQYLRVGEVHQLDVYGQLGFRVTSFWTLGLGYGYRVQYGEDREGWITQDPVYGFRHFQYLNVYKSFYLAAVYELTRLTTGQEPGTRGWHNQYLVGVGKSYELFDTFKGHLQVLYNFDHGLGNSYHRRFNLRFVFDFGAFKEGRKKRKYIKEQLEQNNKLPTSYKGQKHLR